MKPLGRFGEVLGAYTKMTLEMGGNKMYEKFVNSGIYIAWGVTECR